MNTPTAGGSGTSRGSSLPILRVGNDELELAFLPTVGARLISLRVGGAELLWRNPDHLDDDLGTVLPRDQWPPLDGTMGSWANLGGSKTWPAPQGWSGPDEWPGPPDPVLDSGDWRPEVLRTPDAATVVTFTSPEDPRTGLRVERRFEIPAAGTAFRQRITFRCVADHPVRWAPWEVCQVDTAMFAGHDEPDAGVWVGVTGCHEPSALVRLDGEIAVGDPADGRRRVEVADVIAKVGFTDADGTIEVVRPDGAGLRWTYHVAPGAYPDGGCAAEIWMQYPAAGPVPGGLWPTARLLELEALAPLTTLDPGQELAFEIGWSAWGPAAP
ncbi:hypothetical protein Q6348_14385 [Isoptericola sp. b441]|uniref:DUF4380 domain-containing protein n=1 Tax=Actinotalea lenta TaxID=3064654 RepID=A0ABT9DDN8_9CELL|nr:hypothetical protein [Isoptericola sp. b441]MDO8108383.1 hypothetical protein [Isoptericola sp. b441]